MKPRIAILLAAIAAALATIALLIFLSPLPRASASPRAPRPPAPFRESFDRPGLDPAAWALVSHGEPREGAVDILHGRLRLRGATAGTDPIVLGTRSAGRVDLRPGARLAVDLDAGGGPSGVLLLAPQAVDGNPLTAPAWLKIEVAGPRLLVELRRNGREIPLFAEPRDGRPTAPLRLELLFRADGFELRVNDVALVSSAETPGFAAAHLYLLLLNRSSPPAREVFWDNLRASRAE